MTSNQLIKLNSNLRPTSASYPLLPPDEVNQFVLFFYKIKNNYDRYQQQLSICPINISWKITKQPSTSTPLLLFDSNENIPGVLSAKFYKYILQQHHLKDNSALFSSYIFKALEIDSQNKRQASNYFRGLKCCDNLTITNYNKYYFQQRVKYIGNR